MKKFTINDIKSWQPDYDPNHYLAESWEGTALDILNEKRISFQDRLWVIMRTDLVSEKLMRKFAVWCARQVRHLMVDERSLHALDVMEAYVENRWLIDDPGYVEAWEKELTAAQIEAGVAVSSTAYALTAAQIEAGVAVSSTAYALAAARTAAAAAAEDPRWAAMWSATLNAAFTAQEQKLREMLIEGIATGDTK